MMLQTRKQQLSNLQTYIHNVDKEVTMILQSLQWDRNTLLSEKSKSTTCINESNTQLGTTAEKQRLQALGYGDEDKLLPEPLDPNANTIVKLSSEDIKKIIQTAAQNNPQFKTVFYIASLCVSLYNEMDGMPPCLSPWRGYSQHTPWMRGVLYMMLLWHPCQPAMIYLTWRYLMKSENRTKTRTEILAELRDMKRRRTKYRVAAKTQNYSHVLRDVIRTQMELYTDVKTDDSNPDIKMKSIPNDNSLRKENGSKEVISTEYQRKRPYNNRDTDRPYPYRHRRSKSRESHEIEKRSKRSERDSNTKDNRQRDKPSDIKSKYEYKERSRTEYYENNDYIDSQRENKKYEEREHCKQSTSREDRQRRDRYREDDKRSYKKHSRHYDRDRQYEKEREKYGDNSRQSRKNKSDRKYNDVKIKQEIDDGSYDNNKSRSYVYQEVEVKREKY